jgi:class 3 adenylate cyclase
MAAMANSHLPQGTVTFLVADVEGSTDLAAELGEGYNDALASLAELQRRAVAEWGGVELVVADDRYRAVFASARDAAGCAVDVQRSVAAVKWPGGQDVRVRIGLHTGEAQDGTEGYQGTDLRRAVRIAEAGHGGQIVISAVTAALNERQLPLDTVLRDCGNHELKDLAYPEHLYQLVVEGLREDFPPLRTLSAVQSNLPTRTEPFIGRVGETSRLIEALGEDRVVTLTGAAGIGKTSLAIRAAGRVTDQFTDGVWLVDVSRLGDETLIPSAVAKVLGISEGGSQTLTELILSRLLRSSLLLVLDGCEHLVAGVRGFVTELLADTAHVRVLVTSREALAVPGERVVLVAPLAIPVPGWTSPTLTSTR